MGAEQSREGGQRKAETANFDFRFDVPTDKDDTKEPTLHKWPNKSKEEAPTKTGDFHSNCYWLEVGMDVVKRIDNNKEYINKDTYNNFYSR